MQCTERRTSLMNSHLVSLSLQIQKGFIDTHLQYTCLVKVDMLTHALQYNYDVALLCLRCYALSCPFKFPGNHRDWKHISLDETGFISKSSSTHNI